MEQNQNNNIANSFYCSIGKNGIMKVAVVIITWEISKYLIRKVFYKVVNKL
jgi:hypothetical protein